MSSFCLSVDQLHNDSASGLSPSRQNMQCTATGTVPTADWDLMGMLVLTAMSSFSRKPKASSSFVLLPLGLSVSSVCLILCRHQQLILMVIRAVWLMLAQGLCKATHD